MKCPKCGEDNNMVLRTDDSTMLSHIRRARLCGNCRFAFETVETATGDDYFKRRSSELTPDMFEAVMEKRDTNAKLARVHRELEISKRKGEANAADNDME